MPSNNYAKLVIWLHGIRRLTVELQGKIGVSASKSGWHGKLRHTWSACKLAAISASAMSPFANSFSTRTRISRVIVEQVTVPRSPLLYSNSSLVSVAYSMF